MQTERILTLVGSAAVALACQYGITVIYGQDPLAYIGSGFCAYFGFIASFLFVLMLSGNLLRGKDKVWLFVGTCIAPAILILLAYVWQQALYVIDILLFIGIVIRLLQWTLFEPNGRKAFEPAT